MAKPTSRWVELPDKIVLVTYSEPGMKGDTATRTLEAGHG